MTITLKIGAFAAGVIVAAFTAPPAKADAVSNARMQLLCATSLCLYDNNNQLVGQPFPSDSSYGAVSRLISGTWYGIDNAGNDGIAQNVYYVYATPYCVGSRPYLESDKRQLPYVQYDGHALWAGVGTSATFSWRSILTAVSPTQSTASCYTDPYCGVVAGYPCTFTGAPAQVIENRTFTPPLKIKLNGF